MNQSTTIIDQAIAQVNALGDLSQSQMHSIVTAMLAGQIDDDSMKELLVALHAKGETVDEMVGAAVALRQAMTPISTDRTNLLDTCGTGGDGSKTFNISTAAAIVAAAAGAAVAKHGNRKVTSLTGSADVLAELGIRIDAPREVVERCISQLGIGFCFAPLLHPAMKHVAAVRRSIGTPTLFNFLGPLCNPAAAPYQVLGVGKEGFAFKIANALYQLKPARAIVVRGEDGLDEVTLSTTTQVLLIEPSGLTQLTWSPESFGLKTSSMDSMIVNSSAESAEVIRLVLSGVHGPARDIVIANAAAGVWLVGLEPDLIAARKRCEAAIDNGTASSVLQRLASMTHGELT
jgi:anthranilate phosphoribosyltransferase